MNKNPHVMNKSIGYQIVDKVWVLYRCPELVMDQRTQCRNVYVCLIQYLNGPWSYKSV